MFYVFCDKCGRVFFGDPDLLEKGMEYCDVCGNNMLHVPEKYIRSDEILTDKASNERINEPHGLIEELVKTSPNFDQYYFDHRDEILAKKTAQMERALTVGKAILDGADPKIAFKNAGKNLPKCPTCGSLSVEKIGGLERAASVGFWGLFSNKINKTYKCKNCGHTW